MQNVQMNAKRAINA